MSSSSPLARVWWTICISSWCGHWPKTMWTSLAKTIPVPWCNALATLLLASAPGWAVADLATLVSAHRQHPTAATRAAIQSYAVTHPRETAAAHLALGIAAFEQKDYAAAIASLSRANIPQLADYSAYYLAAAKVESRTSGSVPVDLSPVGSTEVRSPLAGRAWVIEGRA